MVSLALAAGAASPLLAQTAAMDAPGVLAPALGELHSTLGELHVNKWKAPDAVRQDAQGNVDSMARDLNDTLPLLLDAARAAPGSLPGAFAVYRNIDALYDVLLRVSGTADLAAPDREAQDLEHSLQSLEYARKSLGDSILARCRAEEGEMAQLRASAAAQAAAATAAAAPTPSRVVSDGPATGSARKAAKPKPKLKPPPQTTPQ